MMCILPTNRRQRFEAASASLNIITKLAFFCTDSLRLLIAQADRGESRFDWVGRPLVLPMLGGEVIEGQQLFFVFSEGRRLIVDHSFAKMSIMSRDDEIPSDWSE
jgi:hypothetical protein